MSLTSRVTVNDGTTTVNIDARSTLRVRVSTQPSGGATNLRMADGSITRQVSWEKLTVTVICGGWMPPGLDSIDWSKQITLTVPGPGGTTQYVGYADAPQDDRTAADAIDCEWILRLQVG